MKSIFSMEYLKYSVTGLFILASLCYGFYPITVSSGAKDEDAYHIDVSRTYDFRFGENPFAPSNATTSTGKFIKGTKFIASSRCAECHKDTHAQWLESAHRNSFREPFYQKNVKDLIEQRGIEFTRHCESCHNPPALFSGALTKNVIFKDRPFDEEGVSCISCHSITSVNGKGIGGYEMSEPALLVKEDGTRLLEGVTNAQIIEDVASHRRAMMRDVLKSPEFCSSCHKSQVPRELNDYKFLRAFMVGDELQMSSFSKESPHPFYARDKATCNSCHMPATEAPLMDMGAKQGRVASHRWPAANTAIPYFYNYQEQLKETIRFLQADVIGIDIFALRRKSAGSGEELIAPLNRSDFSIKAGDTLTADVVITNKNIGHSFPPELRDFYEAYVEFTVKDDTGRELFKSGYIKPDGYLDDSAHNYKTYLVMADGSFNDKHHIWKTRTIAQNNQIHSGRSDMARYRFTVPRSVKGLNLIAHMKYRRFTRVFSDYVLEKSVDYPIVTLASSEYRMAVGENYRQEPAKGAMPDWRRWNNYGIALLDQKQFALSAESFERVVALDEAYRPMALVNRALALIELDRWDEASTLIDTALKISPANKRAIFQRARIKIKRGELDSAESDIRLVLSEYPRDRISLHQLGELSKIKRDYKTARDSYERILKIDPEDAGAHYNLMLIYRKLGLHDLAKIEARLFADLKDDPSALPIASDFLRRNPLMKSESLPWHIHDLKTSKELSTSNR
jgi:tetratricopeptide (TPR) repeat protein